MVLHAVDNVVKVTLVAELRVCVCCVFVEKCTFELILCHIYGMVAILLKWIQRTIVAATVARGEQRCPPLVEHAVVLRT